MAGIKKSLSMLQYRKDFVSLSSCFGPSGEMVDTLVSGASASRHVGSSPISGTMTLMRKNFRILPLFLL